MNKLFKYICVILFLATVFVACEEDESTTYQREYESILTYSSLFSYDGEHDAISAVFKDPLSFELDSVKIYGGDDNVDRLITDADSTDYEFGWYFAGAYDAKGFDNIGRKICDGYTLKLDGNLAAGQYSVVFVVQIKGTGLYFLSSLPLIVKGIGNGLSILDTKDNGETYTLNEIMSEHVTESYQDGKDRIYQNLASLSRAEYGEVTGLMYSNKSDYRGENIYFKTPVVFSTGGDHFTSFDEYYNRSLSGDALFAVTPEYKDAKPAGNGGALILNNGQIHTYSSESKSFSRALPHYYEDDAYYISQFATPYKKYGVGYDELKNRFVLVKNSSGYITNLSKTSESDPELSAEDMGNWDAINSCMFYYPTGKSLFVLREEGGSQLKGVIVTCRTSIKAIENIDLSGLENFDGTNDMASVHKKTIIYYTSGNKLYAFSTDTDTPTSNLILELDGDEEFTHFTTGKNYKTNVDLTNPNDPDGLPSESDSRAGLMICGIYNNSTGEGRIETIPITNTGSIVNCLETNPKYIKKFEGFGKIITWAWTSTKVSY